MSQFPSKSRSKAALAMPHSRTARPLRFEFPQSFQRDPYADTSASAHLLDAPVVVDPLALTAQWGVSPRSEEDELLSTPAAISRTTPSHAPSTLSDMLDRAAAQVSIVRRAVEDASSADKIIRKHAGDLIERLNYSQQVMGQLDQRLSKADKASQALEKAASSLETLGAVVEHIRTAHTALSSAFESRLSQQKTSFESRLSELDDRFRGALEDLIQRTDALGHDAQSTIEHAQRSTDDKAQQLMAKVDRHAAQAQARVSLILDAASERLDVLDDRAQRLGGPATETLEAMCAKAQSILGHDPSSTKSTDPTPGSLSHTIGRAAEIVELADEAAVRMSVLRSQAELSLTALTTATQEARETMHVQQSGLEALRQSVDSAQARAQETQATLVEVTQQQARAIEQAQESSSLLLRQREDLGTIAQASRYHIDLAKSAQQALESTIQVAGSKHQEIQHSMDEVTGHLSGMVQLARKIAGMMNQPPASESLATPEAA